MSIALLFCCLVVPFMIPLAVLLSVLSGVAGYLCPSSSVVICSGTIVCEALNSEATSNSAADETTIFNISAML